MKSLWTAAVAVAFAGAALPALAQYVPAGMEGTWRVHKLLRAGSGAQPGAPCTGTVLIEADRGQDISLGEHSVVWRGKTFDEVKPQMQTISAGDFASEYLNGGQGLHDLGLNAAQVELLKLGNSQGLPFDTVIAKTPSTLIFGRCGVFYDAVRHGDFKAPRLPR
jgi:hypothetical protein